MGRIGELYRSRLTHLRDMSRLHPTAAFFHSASAKPAGKAATLEELFALIDSTGQADIDKRDAIDDMPPGNNQLVAARSLLPVCLTKCNDMFIFLKSRPPSELRRHAIQRGCDRSQVYKAAANIT